MINAYNRQINAVYSNCLQSYRECAEYIEKHKEGDIDAYLISMTTRRKLYKECLGLLSKMYRLERLDITRFLKLKLIHKNQLTKLGNRSLKKNRIFFSQLESLFRRCLL